MTDESGPVGVPVDNPVVLSEDDAELVDLLRAGDADALAFGRGLVAVDAAVGPCPRVDRRLRRGDGPGDLVGGRTRSGPLPGPLLVEDLGVQIFTNQAKSRGVRESPALPWSSLGPEDQGPTVDPGRFRGPDDQWPGGWTVEGRPTGVGAVTGELGHRR